MQIAQIYRFKKKITKTQARNLNQSIKVQLKNKLIKKMKKKSQKNSR